MAIWWGQTETRETAQNANNLKNKQTTLNQQKSLFSLLFLTDHVLLICSKHSRSYFRFESMDSSLNAAQPKLELAWYDSGKTVMFLTKTSRLKSFSPNSTGMSLSPNRNEMPLTPNSSGMSLTPTVVEFHLPQTVVECHPPQTVVDCQ